MTDPTVIDIQATEIPEPTPYQGADFVWIREKCENLLPGYASKEKGYEQALELLVLDLRHRVAMNVDRSIELVNIAERIKHSLRGG